MNTQEKFMLEAIKEAKKAYAKNEVPIGAVIVLDNKIIARAHNKRNSSQIATHHAEILAIEKACKKLKSWRLENAEIYVTLEPCPMCAGAIVNARIPKLFFGAFDKSSKLDQNLLATIFSDTRLNHNPTFIGGILEGPCADLLSTFFNHKRTEQTKINKN